MLATALVDIGRALDRRRALGDPEPMLSPDHLLAVEHQLLETRLVDGFVGDRRDERQLMERDRVRT